MEPECDHENVVEDNFTVTCIDCGTEFETMDYRPEWRNYNKDGCQSQDLARCHSTKTATSRIRKLLDSMLVPEAVARIAEEKCMKIVGDDTIRGDKSKAIVAASLLHAYRQKGIMYTNSEICTKFTPHLTKKIMSQGLSLYYITFPDDRVVEFKLTDLMPKMVKTLGIEDCSDDILQLFETLDGTSPLLNRSKPRSVAAAIIFYYLCSNPEKKAILGLTKAGFAGKVGISDITLSKLARECRNLLKTDVEV